jgi:hypothetical protein
MANATAEDAKSGWRIYRSTVPRPTLESIHASLTSNGREPESPRMFKHYKNLERHEYAEYMPINDLDMRLKAARMRQAS